MPKQDLRGWKETLGLSYVGLYFVVMIMVLVLGGNWLDQRFHKSPLFVLTGLLLGVVAGFRELFTAVSRTTKPKPSGASTPAPAQSAPPAVEPMLPPDPRLPQVPDRNSDGGNAPPQDGR